MLYKNICGIFLAKTSHTAGGHQRFILHLVKRALDRPFKEKQDFYFVILFFNRFTNRRFLQAD